MDSTREHLELIGKVGLSLRRDGRHTRVAVTLTGKSASVDVLRQDGSLLCRLNLFEFPEHAGDVDIILDPETQVGTFLAWKNGREFVRKPAPGITALAVDIKPC